MANGSNMFNPYGSMMPFGMMPYGSQFGGMPMQNKTLNLSSLMPNMTDEQKLQLGSYKKAGGLFDVSVPAPQQQSPVMGLMSNPFFQIGLQLMDPSKNTAQKLQGGVQGLMQADALKRKMAMDNLTYQTTLQNLMNQKEGLEIRRAQETRAQDEFNRPDLEKPEFMRGPDDQIFTSQYDNKTGQSIVRDSEGSLISQPPELVPYKPNTQQEAFRFVRNTFPRYKDLSNEQILNAAKNDTNLASILTGGKGTNITLNTGTDVDLVKGTQKNIIDDLTKNLLPAARGAEGIVRSTNRLINLQDDPTYTGAFADQKLFAAQFLRELGMEIDNESYINSRETQAGINEMVLAFMAQMGGARGFTENETKILYDIFPKLQDDVASRKRLLKILQNKGIRAIQNYSRQRSLLLKSAQSEPVRQQLGTLLPILDVPQFQIIRQKIIDEENQ